MTLKLVEAPPSEPVSPEEAIGWLRANGCPDADLDTITRLIKVATGTLDGADGYLGRCLVTQTWAMTLDRFPCEREIRIPLPPLQEVVSVKYLDAAGVEQTFASSNYRQDSDDWAGRILLKSGSLWPTTLCEWAAVTITFKAGYAAGVPEALRNEIFRLIGIWFDDRPKVGQLPDDWSSQYRLIPVG